ncbi:MAG: hypothetical protein R2745_08055 [Vicinamibacterales bacterium]
MLRKTLTTFTHGLAIGGAFSLLMVGAASADTWNERTVLTFDAAVQIPGETLQPGTYVFALADPSSSHHLVQVREKEGDGLVATIEAVPLKRLDPKGATVLRFDPAEPGSPPAIRAWFYPGSMYGHEFVYPDEQARHIANRTKAVVLSSEQSGSDDHAGRLIVYDANGVATAYAGDAATMREWDTWRQAHPSLATARAMATEFRGERVAPGDLEDDPTRYMGRTISVDAEVQHVYGPRLFTIDEPHWIDFDGEVLVHAPNALAALVREGDLVTVTGRIKGFAAGDVEKEWGWVGLNPADDDYLETPLFEASRIVGGDGRIVLLIDDAQPPGRVEGQRTESGMAESGSRGLPLTSAMIVGAAGDELVGDRVRLQHLRVTHLADGRGGFYCKAGDDTSLFVLPASHAGVAVDSGDTVSIEGVLLEAPRHMAPEGDAPDGTNEEIYVLATDIQH